ncbi:MAG TPA: DnaD domain protein [Anaerolineales bacterium]|nr:DnaD domain protein [Anaerolineales bacterium]
MKGFTGFRAGQMRVTPMPNSFFSELLPDIEHLGELKLTLHVFWMLSLKEGDVRYVRRVELLEDEILARSLARYRHQAAEAITEALERATARQTLLQVEVESANGKEDLFFLNTPKGRAAVEGILKGEWRPSGESDAPVSVVLERPNIFTLYEQNIGPLTPLLAEELQDAADTYPASWIAEAIRKAVENGARNWRYVRAILERWQSEGKENLEQSRGNTEKSRNKYLDYWKD